MIYERLIHNLVEVKMQIILSPIINIPGKANTGDCGKQIIVKGQLEHFDKLSLFDRFRHVENGL